MHASCSWETHFDIFILRQQVFCRSFKIPKLWKNNGYVSLCLRLEKKLIRNNPYTRFTDFFALNIHCVSLDVSVESLSSFARSNEQSVIIWTPSFNKSCASINRKQVLPCVVLHYNDNTDERLKVDLYKNIACISVKCKKTVTRIPTQFLNLIECLTPNPSTVWLHLQHLGFLKRD